MLKSYLTIIRTHEDGCAHLAKLAHHLKQARSTGRPVELLTKWITNMLARLEKSEPDYKLALRIQSLRGNREELMKFLEEL